MDEYCRGCRFLVREGAVCHCLKAWPPRPCPSKESGTPTKADIAQGILEGFVPMKVPEEPDTDGDDYKPTGVPNHVEVP